MEYVGWGVAGCALVACAIFSRLFWEERKRAKIFALAIEQFANAGQLILCGKFAPGCDCLKLLAQSMGKCDADDYALMRPMLELLRTYANSFSMYEESILVFNKGEGNVIRAMRIFAEAERLGRNTYGEVLTWPGKDILRDLIFIDWVKKFCNGTSNNLEYYGENEVNLLTKRLHAIYESARIVRIDLPVVFDQLWRDAIIKRISVFFAVAQSIYQEMHNHSVQNLSKAHRLIELIRLDARENGQNLPDGIASLERVVEDSLAEAMTSEAMNNQTKRPEAKVA